MTVSVSFGSGFAAPAGKIQPRKLVVLESPFANSDPEKMRGNVAYAQMAMAAVEDIYQQAQNRTRGLAVNVIA